MGQKQHAQKGSGKAPGGKRQDQWPVYRLVAPVNPAGPHFRQGIEGGRRPDSDDSRNPEPEDQNGQQGHATAESAQADQRPDHESSQNFPEQERHRTYFQRFLPTPRGGPVSTLLSQGQPAFLPTSLEGQGFRACGRTLPCCHSEEPERVLSIAKEESRMAQKMRRVRSFAALRMTGAERFSVTREVQHTFARPVALRLVSGSAFWSHRPVTVYSDEALFFQVQENFLGCFIRSEIGGVNHHFCVRGRLVGIRNSCKLLDQPGAGFGIKSLAVARLADIERGGKVNQNESSERLDHRPNFFSYGIIRGDRGTDRDAAILRDFRGHVTDPADVDVAMLSRKPQF